MLPCLWWASSVWLLTVKPSEYGWTITGQRLLSGSVHASHFHALHLNAILRRSCAVVCPGRCHEGGQGSHLPNCAWSGCFPRTICLFPESASFCPARWCCVTGKSWPPSQQHISWEQKHTGLLCRSCCLSYVHSGDFQSNLDGIRVLGTFFMASRPSLDSPFVLT